MFDYLNHVNDLYPIRRKEEQKESFRKYVLEEAQKLGYDAKVEKIKEHNNVVIGNPEKAKVIFTAHYDTPAASLLPNLMMPRNIILGYLYVFGYPIILSLLCLAIAYGIVELSKLPFETTAIIFVVLYLGSFYLMTRTFVNKHNKNDNTSGVSTILSLMSQNQGKEVAYILFDNEEKGLLGSKAYNKTHKEFLENKLVINLDCVGFGKNLIFISKKDALKHEYYELLKSSVLETNEYTVNFYGTKGSMSNSDYKNFKCGIGLMTCGKKKLVGFCTPRIHTKYDTLADVRNIEFITENLTNFINKI